MKYQKHLGRFFGRFNMWVDLVLTDNEERSFLVDTKYKLLDEGARHAGLSQPDFYQMYAYRKAGKERYDSVVLLYRDTGVAGRDFEQDGLKIYARQFDPRSIYEPSQSAHKRFDETRLAEELGRSLTIG